MKQSLAEVETRFLELCALPAIQRDEHLKRLEETDPELRASLSAMLAAHVAPDPRLQGDAFHLLAQVAPADIDVRSDGAGGIDSRYQDRQVIGSGSMGTVYQVRDTKLDRYLAMKVPRGGEMLPHVPLRSDLEARFRREAKILGRLDHPGIVPIHEMELGPDGEPFFTMKLVQGRTLSDILRESDHGSAEWPLPRILGLLVRVGEALGYAHSRGVIHRDLKPSNVMIGQFGEVFVMDWGIAKLVGEQDATRLAAAGLSSAVVASPSPEASITWEGDVIGTPEYMAPEQARGEHESVDARTDVFGLGAILHRVLTGEPPFTGRNAAEIALRAAQGELLDPTLRRARKGTPRELREICVRALARRNARYATIDAFTDDLRAFLESKPVSAWRGSLLSRIAKTVRRHPVVATVTAGGLLLLLTGATAVLAANLAVTESRARRRSDDELNLQKLAREDRELHDGLFKIHGDAHPFDATTKPHGLQTANALGDILRAHGWALETTESDRAVGERIAAVAQRSPELHRSMIDAFVDLSETIARSDAESAVAANRYRNVLVLAETDLFVREFWAAELLQSDERGDRITELLKDDRVRSCDPLALCSAGLLVLETRSAEDAIPLLRRAVQEAEGSFWPRYVLALAHSKNREPEAARIQLEAAIAVEPHAPFAQLALGRIHAKKKNWSEATRYYQAASRDDPDSRRARVALAEALRDQEHFDEALEEIQRAIDREPNSALLFHKRGTIRMAAGVFRLAAGQRSIAMEDFDYAMEDFDHSIEIDGKYPYAYLTRGALKGQEGKLQDGLVDLETSARLDPSYAPTHGMIANTLGELGHTKEAIEACQRALKLDPKEPDSFSRLCWLEHNAGENEAAVEAGREAVRLNPNHVKATFNLAIALRALGRDDDALEIFDRFLVDHPRDFWAQNYRAWILHDQQRYAESRTGFERALSIDSSHPETEHGLAHSLQGLGLMTEAREHVSLAREGFERTGVQASSNVDTLCDFACVLHQCGDLERASEYYKRAIDLGQTRSASFQKCAEVLRNLGRCEESLQVIDRWIAIAPGDKSAHCQRAWRLVELDRLDEALVSMRCGAEHSHAGPDQNDPVGRWVQEIESLRAHSDLLSGARGPSSADDWVWLSRWNTRRRRFAEGVACFEHATADLGDEPAWDSLSSRMGIDKWSIFELAAEAAASTCDDPAADPSVRTRNAPLALEWLARGVAARRFDAFRPTPAHSMGWHVSALHGLRRWSEPFAALLHPPANSSWAPQARELLVQIEVLRSFKREL